MVIVRISGEVGNQLFQYAAGCQLAKKLNTELKLDVSWFENNNLAPYALEQFNIVGKIATPKEIEPLKKVCMDTGLGKEGRDPIQRVLNYPDNIYLDGDWWSERYFPDIRDSLLKELTIKNPLSPRAEAWKQKILSAECAVSLHIHHGDFLYNPIASSKPWFHVPPLDYYYNCINALKQAYKNLTVFVFSNNLQWVKENLNLDVPTEFVEYQPEDKRADNLSNRNVEEIYLMSLCKHNINPRSALSWWGAYLNQNPDKKVFVSTSSTAQETLKYHYSLTTDTQSPLDSGKWIYVPFDRDKQPEVKMRPIFSLLLVVNNDAATIADTLNRILGQDYKYYEVIIIDNASFDGSRKICQQAIAEKKNVTFRKLWTKLKNAEAWNIALEMAQGNYISFLKGNDCFLTNALSMLYLINEKQQAEIVHSFAWLMENDKGNITFGAKKCSEQRDAQFVDTKSSVMGTNGQDAVKLLFNKQINNFLSTKIYNRTFLSDNGIKFDECLADDEAEFYFQVECFFKSKYFMYTPNAVYVAPTPKPPVADKAVEPTPKPPIADKAVAPTPKPPVADKAVAPTPKPPVADKAVAPTPKPPVADKAVAPTPKPPVADKAVAPTPKPPVADKAVAPTPKPPVVDKAVAPTPKPPVSDKAVAPTPKPPVADKAVAPTPKPPVADKAVAPTPKPPVADKAVAPTPKPPVADKAVAPTPKPPVADKAVAPTPKPPVADKAVAPTPKPPVADKAVAPTPKPPVADKAVAPTPKPTVADKAVAPTPKPPVADKAVAPTPKPPVADKAVAPTPKPPVADKAVAPTPKPTVADKAVAPTPKPPVADKAVAPTPKPPVADKAVAPTPKPPVADKAVAPTPKPPVVDKAVAPTPKPPVSDNVVLYNPKTPGTARVDIKFTATAGDFQILSWSDERASIMKPAWFQEGGIGYMIHSYAGKLEFVAKSTTDGKIDLYLRALDVREPKDHSKRIPYWVDYTKLTVNGKTIIDKLTPAWHDKAYSYKMDAKAEEEVKIQVEWLPHIDDATNKAVAPTPKPPVADKAVAPTPKPPVADKAVAPTPKPPVADKAVAPTPKPPVADKAVAPTPKPPVADKAVAPTPKPPVAEKAVAPTPKPPVADKAVAPTPKPPVAEKAVAPTPKPPVADKAVAPTPKPPVADKAVAPTPKPLVADKAVAPKPIVVDKAVAPTPKPLVADKAVAPKPIVVDKAVAPTPKPIATVKAIAPTPEPPVKDNTDAQIIDRFIRYLTARIDVKLMSTTGDFQILSISDDKATVWKPKWFQENGKGYQIQSYARKLELIAKATVNGQMRLYLKGLDVRDEKDESKRIPYWIDYTKLTVNGKVIFDTLTPAWHDEPYYYNMDAKAGEEIKIQVEWLPNPKTILGILN